VHTTPFCDKPLIPKEPGYEPIKKKTGNLETAKQPLVQKASKQSGKES
jgi:hypothetical protein